MISYKIEDNGKTFEGQSKFKTDKNYCTEFGKYPTFFDKLKEHVRLFKESDKLKDELTFEQEKKTVNYTIRLRQEGKKDEESKLFQSPNPIELFKEVLNTNIDTPHLILWNNRDEICSVDVDYHSTKSYFDDPSILFRLVTPSPKYCWITKSGGLRFIYFRDETTTAYEYAILAMLCIKHHDNRCSVEFKTDTWHPKSVIKGKKCGEVLETTQQYDDGILSEYMGTYTTDQTKIDEYLLDKGLELGNRYPHDKCPINPSKGDKRLPINITARGIYCYVCNAEDRYYDGVRKTPGFVPYGLLLKGNYVGLVNECLVNYVHFTHAKYILKHTLNVDMKDDQLQTLYRLLLRKRHGFDNAELIEACFNPSLGFIRTDKDWRTEYNEACQFADSSASLKALPITWYRDEEGKLKADPILVEKLTKSHDLSRMGYLDLHPCIGMSLYHTFNTDPNPLKVPFVYQINELANDLYKDRRPQYVEEKDRKVTPAQAYKTLEDMFPGLDMRIIKLLLCIRGMSEVTDGHANFVFIRGSTGSGKTAIVQLASAIVGDNAIDVAWMTDSDDLRRRISESKSKATFIMFNEVIKAGKKAREKQPTSLRFLLNLTPRETYHRLYYGPCQMGRLPVIILTDTDIPATLMVDGQIGRRVIYIECYGYKQWDKSLRKAGMSSFYDLRLISPDISHLCDVILSDVIDRYFLNRSLSYKEIVKELGFCYMNETEDAKRGVKMLRKFFEQWKIEKPVAPDYHGKWLENKGEGWRILDLTRPENSLVEQWLDLADGIEDYDKFRSERITEAPWPLILEKENKNVKCVVERKSSSELAVLFCEELEGRKLKPMG